MKPDSDWKESGALSVEYKYDKLQWSSVVYKNYIYIFGGDSGKILWIDVGVEPYKQGEKLQRLPRWSEGVAFVQNFHGQPAFLSFGGRFKVRKLKQYIGYLQSLLCTVKPIQASAMNY